MPQGRSKWIAVLMLGLAVGVLMGSSSAGALSLPSVSIPGTTLPSTTLPGVTTPAVTTPSVSTPAVPLPSASPPQSSTPAQAPTISVPSVKTPSVKLPGVNIPPPRLRPFRSVVAALPRRAPDPVRARPRRQPGLCRPSTAEAARALDRADRRVRQALPAPMAQGVPTAVSRAARTQAALGRPEAAASPVPPADMGVASRPLLAVPWQRRRA